MDQLSALAYDVNLLDYRDQEYVRVALRSQYAKGFSKTGGSGVCGVFRRI